MSHWILEALPLELKENSYWPLLSLVQSHPSRCRRKQRLPSPTLVARVSDGRPALVCASQKPARKNSPPPPASPSHEVLPPLAGDLSSKNE